MTLDPWLVDTVFILVSAALVAAAWMVYRREVQPCLEAKGEARRRR